MLAAATMNGAQDDESPAERHPEAPAVVERRTPGRPVEPLVTDERRVPGGAVETLVVIGCPREEVGFDDRGMRGATGGLGYRDGIAFDSHAVDVQRNESPVTAGRIQQPVSRIPDCPPHQGGRHRLRREVGPQRLAVARHRFRRSEGLVATQVQDARRIAAPARSRPGTASRSLRRNPAWRSRQCTRYRPRSPSVSAMLTPHGSVRNA